MATSRVRSANSATPSGLAPHLPRTISTSVGTAVLCLVTASTLSTLSQDTLYALFESNIGPLAKGTSMQTPEQPKREEMFDKDARYLVLTRQRESMPGALPRSTTDIESSELLGYASFRFDTEETMGPKDVEVIYCYELQLIPSARGSSLGATLMNELESIGRERGMKKAMLTCLANNTRALRFYEKAGYAPDEIDPTRIADDDGWEDVDENGEEKHCDYRILSKVL